MSPYADIFIVKTIRLVAESVAVFWMTRRLPRSQATRLLFAIFVSQALGDGADLITGNYREANTTDKPLAVAISVAFRAYLLSFSLLALANMRAFRKKLPKLELCLALTIVLPFLYRFTASLITEWSSLSISFLATEIIVFTITVFAFSSAVTTLAVSKNSSWNYLAAGVLTTCLAAICRRHQASMGFPEQSAFYHAVWTFGVVLQTLGVLHLREPLAPIHLSQPSVIKTAKTCVLLATYSAMLSLLFHEKSSPNTVRLVTVLGAGGTCLALYLNKVFQGIQTDFLAAIEVNASSNLVY